MEMMENDRIAKRVNGGVCAVICSVGWPRKRWIDTVKECFKKILDVTQTREWCRIGVNGGAF